MESGASADVPIYSHLRKPYRGAGGRAAREPSLTISAEHHSWMVAQVIRHGGVAAELERARPVRPSLTARQAA
jgi:hypothetical protein